MSAPTRVTERGAGGLEGNSRTRDTSFKRFESDRVLTESLSEHCVNLEFIRAPRSSKTRFSERTSLDHGLPGIEATRKPTPKPRQSTIYHMKGMRQSPLAHFECCNATCSKFVFCSRRELGNTYLNLKSIFNSLGHLHLLNLGR